VLPSNEGRGYVLRRIIRRALRHGYMLGQKQPFFHAMVGALVEVMGDAYPELTAKRDLVERALKAEEERFGETLEQGMKVFEEVAKKSTNVIPGDDAFRLYDTFGFPVDLTADIARERGLSVDMAGFDAAMAQQRDAARMAGKFASGLTLPAELAAKLAPTQFLGYERTETESCDAHVVAILKEGRSVESIGEGEQAAVLLDKTPFYAESGGQVGDFGVFDAKGVAFDVVDTRKLAGQYHAHIGRVRFGTLAVGDPVHAAIDADRRAAIVLNHSATHLLHAALRKVLGEHVTQKGSLVAPDRLRFDFSHFEPIGADELRRIENMVNAEIRGNVAADVRHMAYDEAIASGAMALFGEKYGDEVRVLRMGDFSTELCGGTHVSRTGDIGLFKIVGESGVAAGVRRIEAVTGVAAIAFVNAEESRLEQIGDLLSAHGDEVVDKLRQLFDRQKKLERELESYKAKAASSATQDLAASAHRVGDISIVAARVDGLDAKALREGVDTLKQKLVDCVVLLAAGADGKVALVGGVHGKALAKVKAGDVVAHVAALIDGKGGGRPDMAQGGGIDSPALAQALAALPEWIAARLA
jgi:alanyl-tRNA synthetase